MEARGTPPRSLPWLLPALCLITHVFRLLLVFPYFWYASISWCPSVPLFLVTTLVFCTHSFAVPALLWYCCSPTAMPAHFRVLCLLLFLQHSHNPWGGPAWRTKGGSQCLQDWKRPSCGSSCVDARLHYPETDNSRFLLCREPLGLNSQTPGFCSAPMGWSLKKGTCFLYSNLYALLRAFLALGCIC